jgi:hypothetical protein
MNRAPPLQAGAKDTTTRGSRLSVHLHGADGMRVEDNPHTLRPSLTNTGSSKSPSEKPSQAHVSASSFIVRFGCPREFLTVADIARVQSKSEARGWLFRCGAGSLPFLEEPNKQSTTRTHLPLASCQGRPSSVCSHLTLMTLATCCSHSSQSRHSKLGGLTFSDHDKQIQQRQGMS